MATTDAGLNPLSEEAKQVLVKAFKQSEVHIEDENFRFFQGALYGPPGCGKTSFSLKLANAINVGDDTQTWLFYGEKNSIRVLAEKKWEPLRKNLRTFPFPGINETAYLLNVAEANNRDQSKPKVGTVIIDSFSSCGEMEMHSILKSAGHSRDHPEGYVLKDYGLILNRWKFLFGVASRADINFILICHEQDPDPEELKAGIKKKIYGTEKQANAAAQLLGNILYMQEREFKEGVGRVIRGKASALIEAKSSIDMPEREMLDGAFMEHLQKWMRGEN